MAASSAAERGRSRADAPPPPGARSLTPSHPDWPAGLRALPDPPPVLHVLGALPLRARAVAIVGSRAASAYGARSARVLAADLARLGVAVVSGLARGIDAAAHEGALEADGVSVAVLPSGLDTIVPAYHAGLAARLRARGALVSEWAAGPPPFRGAFVTRNRIIAALAAVTVVVEAGESSGALATAAVARALGTPLLAMPGDADRPTSRGSNALLRAGARWCESAADVMAALPAAAPESRTPEQRLLDALADGARGLEDLAAAAALEPSEALAALLRLEWAGTVTPRAGQRWARAGSAA
jgi:DNA processing protein